jgi:hypothetical protein
MQAHKKIKYLLFLLFYVAYRLLYFGHSCCIQGVEAHTDDIDDITDYRKDAKANHAYPKQFDGIWGVDCRETGFVSG